MPLGGLPECRPADWWHNTPAPGPDIHDLTRFRSPVTERFLQLFGFDVARVQEVLAFSVYTPVPLAPAHVGGLFNLRGQLIAATEVTMAEHATTAHGLSEVASPRTGMTRS